MTKEDGRANHSSAESHRSLRRWLKAESSTRLLMEAKRIVSAALVSKQEMACPLCGDDCHCHATRDSNARTHSRASLNSHKDDKSRSLMMSDEDEPDRSEEQF